MIPDCSSLTLDQIARTLCERVIALFMQQAIIPRQRMLIALAGVPGSGKSTISSGLSRKLSKMYTDFITVVPMVSVKSRSQPMAGVENSISRKTEWLPLHEGCSGSVSRPTSGLMSKRRAFHMRCCCLCEAHDETQGGACNPDWATRNFDRSTELRSWRAGPSDRWE